MFRRMNIKVAVWLTEKVGSMWTAYLFVVLACISLPGTLSTKNAMIIVAWIAQTFIQLVLLPVIMVGNTVGQMKTEKVIIETHELAMADKENDRIVQSEIVVMLEELKDLVNDVHAIMRTLEITEPQEG